MKDTWNPWHGCHKKSEGCANCYMYYLDWVRAKKDGSIISKVKGDFNYPIRKKKDGSYVVPSGSKIRICMTSDFFLEEADQWRTEVWEMIRMRKDVLFWILTKRPERIRKCLPNDWNDGWSNVWLNVTIENQKRAEERLPILLELPFQYKGVMAAPLLEKIDIRKYLATEKIDYMIVSGENYAGARICDYEWVKFLYEQAKEYNVTMDFFETGEQFRKDGKVYFIPKSKQRQQANKSGLYYVGRPVVPFYKAEKEVEQLTLFDVMEKRQEDNPLF